METSVASRRVLKTISSRSTRSSGVWNICNSWPAALRGTWHQLSFLCYRNKTHMEYLSHLFFEKQILSMSSYDLASGHRHDRIPAHNDGGAFSCVLIISPPSAVTGERAASSHRETSARWTIWSVECVWRRVCKECNTRCVCAGGSWAAAGRFHMTSWASHGLCVWNTLGPVSHLSFSFSSILKVISNTFGIRHVFQSVCATRSFFKDIHFLSINTNHCYVGLRLAAFRHRKIHWLFILRSDHKPQH